MFLKAFIFSVTSCILLAIPSSCKKTTSLQTSTASSAINNSFDIILLIGQSNTLAGTVDDSSALTENIDPRIFQLGRFGTDNHVVIPAKDPLQNITPVNGCIGFASTFAKLYADCVLQPGRKVLIIPCGAVSTGFSNNHWNRGNDDYSDAVQRANFALDSFANSRIVCILWHQGEQDVKFGTTAYQGAFENMRNGLFIDIKAKNLDSIPFILGGLVPYWVQTNPQYQHIDSALMGECQRLPLIGFADPTIPFVIQKPDNTVNAIHFDGNGQIEMGKRYFAQYQKLSGK